jgi:hypothetical protein
MASREEIIQGLEFTLTEAKRTTAFFAEDEWGRKRAAGWTPKEVYSHLAAVAAMVPQMAQGLMGAPEDQDIAGGMDINQINSRSVQAMSSMTPQQVMQSFEDNYRRLIDMVKSLPEEQLQQKRTFLSYRIPVSDILANTLMLHGIHHVYEASSRFESPA